MLSDVSFVLLYLLLVTSVVQFVWSLFTWTTENPLSTLTVVAAVLAGSLAIAAYHDNRTVTRLIRKSLTLPESAKTFFTSFRPAG